MNQWIFVALCVFGLFSGTSLAWADEGESSSPYEDNLLGVLHYRRAENVSFLSLNAETRLHDQETANQNGINVGDYSRTSWQSTVGYTYGLTDHFEMGITETYYFGVGTSFSDPSNGTTSSYSANGFSDPTLAFNYRYWGDLKGTHFGSAYINLTPSIGSHQNADSSRSGNEVSASTSATLGTNLYWVLGRHELEVNPLVRYVTAGTNNDVNPANTYYFNAYFNYAVNGAYRFHFCPKFYMNLNLELNGAYTATNNYSNRVPYESYSENFPLYVTPSLSVGWKPADHYLVTASYSYNSYSYTSSRTVGPSTPNTNYAIVQDLLTVTGAWEF